MVRYPALFKGLTYGLSGSITSFTTWIIDIYFELTGRTNPGKYPYQNMLAGLSTFLVVLGMSFSSFHFGKYLSQEWLSNRKFEPLRWVAGPPSKLCFILWTLLFGFSVLSGLLVVTLSHKYLGIGILTGIIGTWIRYFLALLNREHHWVPFGTLIGNSSIDLMLSANFMGTLIAVITTALSYKYQWAYDKPEMGIIIGFCGCLTTMSTFVKELSYMRLKRAVAYLLLSCIPSLGVVALIVEGFDRWF
jgi:CrcB protein